MNKPFVQVISAADAARHEPHDLTDEQWHRARSLLPLFVPEPTVAMRRARPRDTLNGILWKISTRRPWSHIPAWYPTGQYCKTISHRWDEAGLLAAILRELYGDDAARLLDEARRQTPRYAERSPWQPSPSPHGGFAALEEQEAQR